MDENMKSNGIKYDPVTGQPVEQEIDLGQQVPPVPPVQQNYAQPLNTRQYGYAQPQ